MTNRPHRLIIAGGGVAGLEALTALSALVPGRLDITVVAPRADFALAARSVEEPFGRPHARRHQVAQICADHGAEFVLDGVASVDVAGRGVVTEDGARIGYDSLLVAVGARRLPVLGQRALVFRGQQDAEAFHGLVQDLEGGYLKRAVFVVPSGVTWPLPLYELALMAAGRAQEMGHDDFEAVVVTPEELPLGVFGRRASAAVQAALDAASVEVRTATYVDRLSAGLMRLSPSGEVIEAGRVVTIPRLAGPRIAGLPCDEEGFLPVDDHCAVRGAPDVFAAGDGTSFPVKQGGIAAQQADTAALAVAQRAGARVDVRSFDPVLRAKLLTGDRAEYLREAFGPGGGEHTSFASEDPLWWPPAKVAAPYLTGYLEGLAASVPAAG